MSYFVRRNLEVLTEVKDFLDLDFQDYGEKQEIVEKLSDLLCDLECFIQVREEKDAFS
jgi:hypothetical protein